MNLLLRFLAVYLGLCGVGSSAFCCLAAAEADSAGQLLYNGIRLPSVWPPRQQSLGTEPMPVPYLQQRPEVVPIDIGRQLLIDDFLIERSTLRRTFHRPVYHRANPVLRADKPWEKEGRGAAAMVFSDGVWWDQKDQKFKMWYMGGMMRATCYAESRDGVNWDKPMLDVEPGTNIVLKGHRDSSTVWLDHNEPDPQKRFKLLYATVNAEKRFWQVVLRTSPDGVHWSDPVAASPRCGDRSTFFYNPFRKVWVLSLRNWGLPRSRQYREHADLLKALQWSEGEVVPWVGADRLDPRNPDPRFSDIPPQLYNLDAVAYESLILGLFSVWQGPDNSVCAKLGIQKRNEVLLGYSRDGFHWHRPDRQPFIAVNPVKDAWNWGNVQSCGGGCLVVGDKLYFYFSGRALNDQFWDGAASTGLAILRRDGFCSLDAESEPGELLTRPLLFKGKHLFVNVAAAQGELKVELLDQQHKAIEPFTIANCEPIRADKTLVEVKFRGAKDLSALAGRPVRMRFQLRNGSLYSFWVSPDSGGASHGYVAAGGPGLLGATDAAGEAAYIHARRRISTLQISHNNRFAAKMCQSERISPQALPGAVRVSAWVMQRSL